MFFTDKKLMQLQHYLKDHHFDRLNVADYLSVSNRHLSRLMKRWQEENLIIYRNGLGRGRFSTVTFLVDAEVRYIRRCLDELNRLTMDDIFEILDMPLSSESKIAIRNAIEMRLFDDSWQMTSTASEFMLVEYIKYIPEDIMSSINVDFDMRKIVYNTMNRLFELDAQGNISYSLVAHYEWEDENLYLFLKKGVKYFNGDTLYSGDVVSSLNVFFKTLVFPQFQENIKAIRALSKFKLVIEMNEKNDLIILLLTSLNASIYKWNENIRYTTGPYYISDFSDRSLTLARNSYHLKSPGDIGKILFFTDMEKYMNYMAANEMKSTLVEGSRQLNILLINPDSSRLNREQRYFINHIAAKYITMNDLKISDIDETYRNYIDMMSVLEMEPPVFNQAVHILYVGNYRHELEKLVRILTDNEVPVIANSMSPAEFTDVEPENLGIDIAIITEFVPDYYKYLYLLRKSKFKEWFIHTETAQYLFKIYRKRHKEYWKFGEERFERYLQGEGYAMPLNNADIRMNIPGEYKNVKNNMYDVIDYDGIIADVNRECAND